MISSEEARNKRNPCTGRIDEGVKAIPADVGYLMRSDKAMPGLVVAVDTGPA